MNKRAQNFYDKLIRFKNLEIDKVTLLNNQELLTEQGKVHVIVTIQDLLRLLQCFRAKEIDSKRLLEWVNVIWFSDFYDYDERDEDLIADIMNDLEEIDEPGRALTDEQISRYISQLTS